MIFNNAWTVDGIGDMINMEDGTITKLPEFYDLFPHDWDLPFVHDNDIWKITN